MTLDRPLDRRILHLDMDAFFASVELLRYPMLKGQSVVVGGRRVDAPRKRSDGGYEFARLGAYGGRGVVTTATYEARSEEHTSELQSRGHLVCRLLLEKKKDAARDPDRPRSR